MAASTKWLNLKRPWTLPDITPFSRMQQVEVCGASDLTSLFYTKGVHFLWVVSVTLYNNAYWVFKPLQVMWCNQSEEIKQLMCDIAVYITKAQDNAEMGWLVYEIKLGTSIVSLSTVYCKFYSLNVCILNYCILQACVCVFCFCRGLQTDICASDNLQFS